MEHDVIMWKKLDPLAKKAWRVKGLIVFGLILVSFAVSLLLVLFYAPLLDDERLIVTWVLLTGVVSVLVLFILYNIWISMYFKRYCYALGSEGLLINRGIWWKYKRTVPYARIQHISIDQGPIEQIFKIYRVNSYTAGTGSAGPSSAGNPISGPEGQILGVRQPDQLRDDILKHVMQSRIGDGVNDMCINGKSNEIVEELRAIRTILESKR
ncbi:MAG: PH domain-containing protein [Thermoplasmatota archaeon]